ncbi:unnamed protein product [Rangifer tarandus platyrhynchus]|uniref:Uncharacterized protein n=1 Tax=Rangifer tarandus platyrhynchus TaxID=3082113 RepID=A0ABN8YRC4_RANTA|nr:unnamed protein product [Rangifer tarandus platyrhynchus]
MTADTDVDTGIVMERGEEGAEADEYWATLYHQSRERGTLNLSVKSSHRSLWISLPAPTRACDIPFRWPGYQLDFTLVTRRSSIASSLYPSTSLSTLHCRSFIGRCPPALNFTSTLTILPSEIPAPPPTALPDLQPSMLGLADSNGAPRPQACGVPLTSASPVKSFLLGPQARGFLSPFRSGSAVIRVSVFA